MLLSSVIPESTITYMPVTGSLIIFLIGSNMLGITKVKTANLVPAIFLPLAIAPLFEIFIWHRLARVIRKTSKKTENF